MQIYEPPLVVESVNSKSQRVTDAENGAKRIGSEPQVCDFPEKFKAMPFRLKGILRRIAVPQNFQG